MSNKNLLNEAQIRQFMKLAKLEPLTPGFVNGLAEAAPPEAEDLEEGTEAEDLEEGTEEEDLEEVRAGASGQPRDTENGHGSHGRGRDPLEEDEESELYATEDELGHEDREADEEGEEIEDLEGDLDVDDVGGGRTISVDDFLEALESALEAVMDDEVEVSEEPPEDELEADVELGMGDDDLDVDMEEEPLEESAFREPPSATGAANTNKGSKQHPDHRNKKSAAAKLKGAPSVAGPGLVKEEDDELEEGETPEADGAAVTTEDLVERITKRVAARILKSALTKK